MKTQIINGRSVVDALSVRKLATPGSVHIDQLMTDFAINYGNLPFIGRQVFPTAPVQKESDKYAIFNSDRRQQRVKTGLRAPKSRAEVVDWKHTTASYACQEYAFAAGVDDRERDNADAPIAPDQRATAAAVTAIELAMEARIATLVTTAGSYAAAHKTTLVGAAQWSTAASAVLSVKLAADEAIQADAGVLPNSAIIPFKVFNKLRLNTEVKAAFAVGGVASKTGLVTREQLAAYFDIDVERLFIPGGVKNTAALGAAATLADIWGDFAWFGFVDPGATSPLDGITFGKIFAKAQEGLARLTREFRDDPARTDYKEVSEITDEKITAIECGYLVSDTLA